MNARYKEIISGKELWDLLHREQDESGEGHSTGTMLAWLLGENFEGWEALAALESAEEPAAAAIKAAAAPLVAQIEAGWFTVAWPGLCRHRYDDEAVYAGPFASRVEATLASV